MGAWNPQRHSSQPVTLRSTSLPEGASRAPARASTHAEAARVSALVTQGNQCRAPQRKRVSLNTRVTVAARVGARRPNKHDKKQDEHLCLDSALWT